MSSLAVAHYPEGAGHATRMLALTKALEARGASVTLAGGGHGARFVREHGYDEAEPPTVDFIGDYQGGSLLHVCTRSLPRSGARVAWFVRWLRRERPDALVTDDMFAAMAAPLADVPLFVVTHNAASLYDAVVEQGFTWLLNRYQETVARHFLYPTVWPPVDDDPHGAEHVPPVALEAPDGCGPVEEVDVLVVPSTYSEGFDDLAADLRADGHEVTHVGDLDWDPVPALLPWARAADVVVCSGYSTVMEAAVAGTPCIIYPFTDEQHGVARRIERGGVTGFQVEHSPAYVRRAVDHPPAAPTFENGAGYVAERVLAAL